jgi:hypothetical protein
MWRSITNLVAEYVAYVAVIAWEACCCRAAHQAGSIMEKPACGGVR